MQLECSQLQGIGSESWQPCKFCHAGERDDCPLFNALQFAAAAPPHTQSVPLPTHTISHHPSHLQQLAGIGRVLLVVGALRDRWRVTAGCAALRLGEGGGHAWSSCMGEGEWRERGADWGVWLM